jgi:hypothetical protein
MMKPPLVYIILGLEGSGRRDLCAQLAREAFDPNYSCVTLVQANEPEAGGALLAKLAEVEQYEHIEQIELPDSEVVLLVAPGQMSPADSIEAFYQLLKRYRLSPASIIAVYHCALLATHPKPLEPWYQACAHFADKILLGRREGVPQRAMSSITQQLDQAHYPAIVQLVKKGRVEQPELTVDDQPRRLSQLFDAADAIDALDLDETTLPDGPIELGGLHDPYLERHPSGERVLRIPEVSGLF